MPQHPPDTTFNILNDTDVPLNFEMNEYIYIYIYISLPYHHLIPKQNLKEHIEGKFCCRKCAYRVQKKQIIVFLAFIVSELGLSSCQSDTIWLKYVRQSAKRNVHIITKVGLDVSFIENGMAGDMQVRCKTRVRRFKGHVTRCGCDRIENESVKFGHNKK